MWAPDSWRQKSALQQPEYADPVELQRVLAKYCTKGPGQVLLWPGFLVQKITTIEPDDKQLEVALSALLVTLEREQQGAAPEVASERTFDDFSTLTRGAVQAA